MKRGKNSEKQVGLPSTELQMTQRWLIARWMLILRAAIVTATLGTAILIYPKGMIDKTPMSIILIGTYILTLLYYIAHKLTGVHFQLLATEIAFDIFIITAICKTSKSQSQASHLYS